ncbi:MAG TPA: sigma factor, partial [Chloroflexota bacterium]|nr:sigma factor [Chloroflexota bacterium]
MESWSDEKLMSHVMTGDPSALAPLVSRYHAQLLAYAFRLTHCDMATAEDVLQEAFVRILSQRTFQPKRMLRPWLYRVVTNVAYDQTSRRNDSSNSFDEVASGS